MCAWEGYEHCNEPFLNSIEIPLVAVLLLCFFFPELRFLCSFLALLTEDYLKNLCAVSYYIMWDLFFQGVDFSLLLTWRSLSQMGRPTTAGALASDPNKQLRVTQ